MVLWHKLETEPDSSWSFSHYIKIESWTWHLWGFPRELVLSRRLAFSKAVVAAILWRCLWWYSIVVGLASDSDRLAHVIAQDVGGPETITRCSLGATAFKRQISCLMYFIWPRAGNMKYQEIAMWGLCSVISAVIKSAYRGFFVLSSWTHPAHLRRVSDSNTVSSCKHEMWTGRSNLLYAPEQDLFLLCWSSRFLPIH